MGEVKTSFRMPEELYRKAQEKCQREDMTLSQVLRRLLKQWTEEDPPEGGKPPEK
jgi:hypothetical protein